MQDTLQTTLQVLAFVLTGAAVVAIVFTLSQWMRANDLKKRFTRIVRQSWSQAGTPQQKIEHSQAMSSVISILSKLSLPEEGWQSSSVRLRFLQAGIRNTNAPQQYFAVKTLLTLVLPVMLAIVLYVTHPHIPLTQTLLMALVTAAAGYYLPEMALRLMTSKRVERMRDSLPDMMDLMVVCTESGMGIDAAINRISSEMANASPDLAQEFYLSVLEMRAGATRIEALRNLALRSNLEELNDLVSMLVQADKFGTSLAESFRIQSEVMRSKRTQRAEEIAAKIPVKLVLPLGLFIFPVLMLVLLGPAIIQLMEIFSK